MANLYSTANIGNTTNIQHSVLKVKKIYIRSII